MSRAIQPFATQYDGDVLYAVTTDEVENAASVANKSRDPASEVAWDAVLASVPDLPDPCQRPGSHLPANSSGTLRAPTSSRMEESWPSALQGVSRRYSPGLDGCTSTGRRYGLTPIGPDRLLVEGAARDVLKVERTNGQLSLVLNPGSWNQRATR